MADNFNPSQVVINEAVIRSQQGIERDITALITSASITQSIEMVAYNGYLQIFDTIGLLESFPLRGEEKLRLKISTFDVGTNLDLLLQIYKIDNVTTTEASDGASYTLHFISEISYKAGLRKIIESSSGKSASTIAKDLFAKYYTKLQNTSIKKETIPFGAEKYALLDEKKRTFYIQPSEGLLNVVIPNFAPSEAMIFLARKSFSIDAPSNTFRFFETYDGFYYVTDEFLIKHGIENPNRIIDLYYGPYATFDPTQPERQIQAIERFDNSSRVDTATDIFSGGYRSKVIEVDFVRRRVVERNFDYTQNAKYIDMSGEKRKLADSIHSADFMKETFTEENSRRYLVFRDYSQPGDIPGILRADQHFAEIAANRVSYEYHLNNTTVNASLKGRLDITPGRIINVNVPKFSGLREKDNASKQLGGKYLVHTISHTLSDNVLKTNMRLIKFDWSL